MPSFRTVRRVRHSAAQMLELVADVERYPEFVPLCKSLRVRRRSTGAAGEEVLIADMEVGYRAIHEKFASRVTLDRANHKVLVEYVDGPFSHLENTWNFVDEEAGASRIEFFIAYEFRSRLLGALMGSMFDAAFRKFAQAFETRADVVYGRGNGARA
jgi:coenzyme Q-binding protein COQ10